MTDDDDGGVEEKSTATDASSSADSTPKEEKGVTTPKVRFENENGNVCLGRVGRTKK